MNTKIQVVRRGRLLGVYEGVHWRTDVSKVRPDYMLTRLDLAVVPPEGEWPGYVCVVGERFDGSMRQGERHHLLMDEGQALDPADFTEKQREAFSIPETNLIYPTLKRLAQMVVALKDTYWHPAIRLWVPPGPGSSEDMARRGTSFNDFLLKTEGLMGYDDAFGETHFRKWFPCFKSVRCTLAGFREGRENRDYNQRLIDALFAEDMLTVFDVCKLWDDEKKHTPNMERALGLLLSEWEYEDLTMDLRRGRPSDGYGRPVDDPELEAAADEMLRGDHDVFAEWGGQKPILPNEEGMRAW